MKGQLRFTPFRVGLLYLCGTAMGIGIGMMIADGAAHTGGAVTTAAMAFTSLSVALGAHRRTLPAEHPLDPS